MKNRIIKLFYLLSIVIGMSSCVDFLNQTPDAQNYSEADIFSSYDKSQNYIDQLLVPFNYFDDNDWGGAMGGYGGLGGKSMYGLRERITDNCFTTAALWHTLNNWRNGAMSNSDGTYYAEGGEIRFQTIWKAIRIANMSIANIDMIKGATPEQKAKILGLAYFLRGHFYFQLLQAWGGMPYITAPFNPGDDLNIPRLSYSETAKKIAEDFVLAAPYLPMVVPNNEWNRPSKMAAIAYKAKALTWAASPFSNPASDKVLWTAAAVASGEAIKMAEESGYYHLVTLSEFKNMFCNVTDESLRELIFGRMFPAANTNAAPYYCGIKSAAFGNSWQNASEGSTENLASTYTWANGEPVDPASMEYSNNPFYGDPLGVHKAGRDPRLYETLLFNGARTSQVALLGRDVRMWNKSTYTGGAQTIGGIQYPSGTAVGEELVYNSSNVVGAQYTITGYYNWKLFANVYVTAGRPNLCTNLIRLADIYLYYAECANRAWGYNAQPQGIAGFSLTGLQALNKVRGRQFGVSGVGAQQLTGVNVGRLAADPIMPAYNDASPNAWLKVGSADRFDLLIRNETRVENAFEEKRLYDLRRWKMCTDNNVLTMKGIYVERTGVNIFKYTPLVLPESDKRHLKWQERHYLFQIPLNDSFFGSGFKQNPGW
jgi:hypothetical protein